MSTPLISPADTIYPESDGKPMAETDVHRDWMICLIDLLKHFFAGQRVYVSGNLLVYYVEGDPKRCVAPDAFVVKDCDPGRRRIFKVWAEGKAPNFVIEVTSDKTRREDKNKKKRIYAELRVPEYFLYDPLGDWLDPPLQGYRLEGEAYVPIAPGPQGAVTSEQLSLSFRLEEGQLVLSNAATGERLKTSAERAAEAEGQLANEVAAREALQKELARLRAEKEP